MKDSIKFVLAVGIVALISGCGSSGSYSNGQHPYNGIGPQNNTGQLQGNFTELVGDCTTPDQNLLNSGTGSIHLSVPSLAQNSSITESNGVCTLTFAVTNTASQSEVDFTVSGETDGCGQSLAIGQQGKANYSLSSSGVLHWTLNWINPDGSISSDQCIAFKHS